MGNRGVRAEDRGRGQQNLPRCSHMPREVAGLSSSLISLPKSAHCQSSCSWGPLGRRTLLSIHLAEFFSSLLRKHPFI